MKIEWIEDKFADLAGDDGVFNMAANRAKPGLAGNNNAPRNANAPKKMVPMMRTCHGDLVIAPSAALGM